ncbi:MAG: VCBS repeat-containing protein, partial [Verrucomicrobiae bacterium]|nr:VCBS repeat-containing protein [Verrucomicrobiae bacterium]
DLKIMGLTMLFFVGGDQLSRAGEKNSPSEPATEFDQGRALSERYCAVCHVQPMPDEHDTTTWRKHVFPLMHRNARMTELDPSRSEEERQALSQWRLVWEYYFKAAPSNAIPQGPRGPIRRDLRLFSIEDPLYRRQISYATMVKIDSAARQIYVGNALTRSLDVLNHQGKGLASTKVDSTLTDLIPVGEDEWVGTQIGMVVPDDRPLGRVTLFTKRGGIQFVPVRDLLTKLVRPIETAVGDLNGDDRQDLVVCSYGNLTGVSGKLAWYENRGDWSFDEHELLDKPGPTRCGLVDFNKDGRLDIIALVAQAKEGVYLYKNEGNGDFTELRPIKHSPTWGNVGMHVVDFDRDGDLDILIANGDLGDFECPPKRYHGIRIYLNDGKWKFKEAFFYPLNGAYDVRAADFDCDGDLDIAAISFFPDYDRSPEESFVFLENLGNLRFQAWTFPDCERGRWITMGTGDLDGDGDTDIVLGAAYLTPFRTTSELQERWKKEGPSLLILRNNSRQPPSN